MGKNNVTSQSNFKRRDSFFTNTKKSFGRLTKRLEQIQDEAFLDKSGATDDFFTRPSHSSGTVNRELDKNSFDTRPYEIRQTRFPNGNDGTKRFENKQTGQNPKNNSVFHECHKEFSESNDAIHFVVNLSGDDKTSTLLNKDNFNSKPSRSGNTVKNIEPNDRDGKKPFDKKKWRLQKYSKKYKLQQWEQKRNKAVLREYYKEIKEDRPKLDVLKIYEELDQHSDGIEGLTENRYSRTSDSLKEKKSSLNTSVNLKHFIQDQAQPNVISEEKKGRKPFKKAHLEFQRIKEEKQKKRGEMSRKRAERDDALKLSKKKKAEKFKKLNKKTKKGQPIMKERMEMLLTQIQKSFS